LVPGFLTYDPSMGGYSILGFFNLQTLYSDLGSQVKGMNLPAGQEAEAAQ
jgi:hypothetical protein